MGLCLCVHAVPFDVGYALTTCELSKHDIEKSDKHCELQNPIESS